MVIGVLPNLQCEQLGEPSVKTLIAFDVNGIGAVIKLNTFGHTVGSTWGKKHSKIKKGRIFWETFLHVDSTCWKIPRWNLSNANL